MAMAVEGVSKRHGMVDGRASEVLPVGYAPENKELGVIFLPFIASRHSELEAKGSLKTVTAKSLGGKSVKMIPRTVPIARARVMRKLPPRAWQGRFDQVCPFIGFLWKSKERTS